MTRNSVTIVNPAEMAQVWESVRRRYWAQWGIDAVYSDVQRAEVLRTITRHHRNPLVCAARMERLTLRLDRGRIAQIKRAA